MLSFLSNVFNDPSNPWYYVVGVLFLLLFLGAVAVYVIWSGKKAKKTDVTENEHRQDTEAQPNEHAENTDAVQPQQEEEQQEKEQ